MRFLKPILWITIQGILLSACTGNHGDEGFKQTITACSEQVKKVEQPLQLELRGDSCNIVSSSWDRNEIKLEVTRSVRGTQDKITLDKQLEEFVISLEDDGDKTILTAAYGGTIQNPADRQMDIRLFLPKKVDSIHLDMKNSTIKFQDDIACRLDASFQASNLELNLFKGILAAHADTGNFRVGAGDLHSGSVISTGLGNIAVKAALDKEGSYLFETGHGNVDLRFPYATDFSIDYDGFLETCEFPVLTGLTKVKAVSRFGRIDIRKY